MAYREGQKGRVEGMEASGFGMNRRRTGAHYEERAAEWLSGQGVAILEMNYRTRAGEIDLVGLDGEYLVFFEVKYRSNLRKGAPLLAVTPHKKRQILNTARSYLYERRYRADAPVRFDCVGITPGGVTWVKNAFTA